MENEEAVKIYPNPASTTVHIESSEKVRAVITGMDGRELMNVNAAQDINISELSNGIYVITIYGADNHVMKIEKLVKG